MWAGVGGRVGGGGINIHSKAFLCNLKFEDETEISFSSKKKKKKKKKISAQGTQTPICHEHEVLQTLFYFKDTPIFLS